MHARVHHQSARCRRCITVEITISPTGYVSLSWWHVPPSTQAPHSNIFQQCHISNCRCHITTTCYNMLQLEWQMSWQHILTIYTNHQRGRTQPPTSGHFGTKSIHFCNVKCASPWCWMRSTPGLLSHGALLRNMGPWRDISIDVATILWYITEHNTSGTYTHTQYAIWSE